MKKSVNLDCEDASIAFAHRIRWAPFTVESISREQNPKFSKATFAVATALIWLFRIEFAVYDFRKFVVNGSPSSFKL